MTKYTHTSSDEPKKEFCQEEQFIINICIIQTLNEFINDPNNYYSENEFIQNILDYFLEPPYDEDAKSMSVLLNKFQQNIDDIVINHRNLMMQYIADIDSNKSNFSIINEQHSRLFTTTLKLKNENSISKMRNDYPITEKICQIINSKNIADEQLIVSLFSTTEKCLKQILVIKILVIKGFKESSISLLKWNDLVNKYKSALKIDLKQIKSYAVVNEIRCKCNSIKHDFNVRESNSRENVIYNLFDYTIHTQIFMNRVINSLIKPLKL